MRKGLGALLGLTAMLAACGDLLGERAEGSTSADTAVEPTALPQRYVVTRSAFDFEETLNRLYRAIDRRDLTVFAVIDHAAGARTVDIDLPPATVVIFGNPQIGSPLMLAEPLMAAELPLRAAVFEDEDGAVKVAVTSVTALARQFEALNAEQNRIDAVRGNLRALSDEATGRDG